MCQDLQIRVFEHYVIGKKIKVKLDTAIYHTEEILDYVYTYVGDLLRWYHFRYALLCIIY